ncbi:VOC family protein [Halieaceae bacterium IMCC14734]|uniref:VOC family protein n=1 Tax=Candidatus Litorirhabdus singularis TaxID=2518993 RepID=A0ABT3TJL1_9GAMM|nr:VOC family protein [Candidatus Litorirhabdus singularis]MCX2982508.1 VOC family protein [Candidatus Litorirhabdus singularis]
MFSHIMVGTNDMDASKKFYDAILGALGFEPGVIDPKGRCFYATPGGIFSISIPIDGEPACRGNGSTVGFAANSPAEAEAWHAAGIANGGTTCEDPPGERVSAAGTIYLAYLRDPDGNKVCALHRIG